MTNAELVDTIHERVSDVLDNVERDEVEDRVKELESYGLPDDEIERSVVRKFADDNDMELSDFTQSSGNENASVSEVKEMDDEEWVALRVKFDTAWDTSHENMSQTGLLGDETGRIKFTAWDNSNAPELEEGQSYHIRNVVTEEYNGNINIKFTKNTEADELDDEVEVNTGGDEVEVEGAIVSIQSGSGLIKRCPEEDCTRVLQNGNCSEHGDVEGEFDLRIKAVVDNGNDTNDVIFDREATEDLTGTTLEDAKARAKEELDTEVVEREMRGDIIGRYYSITGPKAGRYVLVDEFEPVTETDDVTELLNRVSA